jgi:hypothetical protein
MRKKLIRNDMFYMHYPYAGDILVGGPPGSTTLSPKFKRINPPISRDSREFHKRFKHQPSLISEIISGTSVSSLEDADDGLVVGSSILGSGSTSSDPTLSPKAQGEYYSEIVLTDEAENNGI